MISPTGNGMRGSDEHGSGLYGASRGGIKRHSGSDFIAIPGQEVIAPCDGDVVRWKYPYAKLVEGVFFGGIFVRHSNYEYTMYYFEPYKSILRTRIKKGQVIGIAQDISLKYPGIIPHIHFHFDSINPVVFMRLP